MCVCVHFDSLYGGKPVYTRYTARMPNPLNPTVSAPSMEGCGVNGISRTAPVTRSTVARLHRSPTPGRIGFGWIATVIAAKSEPATPSATYLEGGEGGRRYMTE